MTNTHRPKSKVSDKKHVVAFFMLHPCASHLHFNAIGNDFYVHIFLFTVPTIHCTTCTTLAECLVSFERMFVYLLT